MSYSPEPRRFGQLLGRLLDQADAILVVDNSPGWDLAAERTVMALPEHGERLRIVRAGMNLGIGAALNIGMAAAIEEGFDYVLLSDQDSLPAEDMIGQLKAVMMSQEQERPVACVMPCYADEVTRHRFGFQVQHPNRMFYSISGPDEADPWVEVLSGITSGSLYPVGVFETVGLMREDYFIDYVDTEWFHRARAHGYRLLGTSRAILFQRLGDASFPVWYLRWQSFPAYSPKRLYYRFRNFIPMCREAHVPLAWKIRAGWYWLGTLYAYLLFSPDRRANARHIARGLCDGFRNRMGPYGG